MVNVSTEDYGDGMVKEFKDESAQKFTIFLLIIATALAGGAFALSWGPAKQFSASDPRFDGYVPPRSLGDLVAVTQKSTVTVYCSLPNDRFNLGTAWALDLDTKVSKKYGTTLITNHHVIEKCIGRNASLTVAALYEEEVPAVIVKWDEKNDLAILATALSVPELALSENAPWPGYWVAAVGSADGYEGSVAFGSVLNTTDLEIFVTNNVSHGNSGGPLVDNEGAVIGVVSWGAIGEQYNGAKSLDAFCSKIIECEGKYYWEREE